MLAAQVFKDADEVERRLVGFGATRQEFVDVVRNTAAERSTTVGVDPLSAAGLLSYIGGTRHLRLMLLPKGYRQDSKNNIESAVHDKRGLKIMYQNVDQACSTLRPPRAISGKRSASAKMIGDAQGSLFSGEELPAVVEPSKLRKLRSAVWYLCVSFGEDGDIRAELSLPAGIRGGNFHGFIERIFLVQRGDMAGVVMPDVTDRVEAEPLIARR